MHWCIYGVYRLCIDDFLHGCRCNFWSICNHFSLLGTKLEVATNVSPSFSLASSFSTFIPSFYPTSFSLSTIFFTISFGLLQSHSTVMLTSWPEDYRGPVICSFFLLYGSCSFHRSKTHFTLILVSISEISLASKKLRRYISSIVIWRMCNLCFAALHSFHSRYFVGLFNCWEDSFWGFYFVFITSFFFFPMFSSSFFILSHLLIRGFRRFSCLFWSKVVI